MSTARLDSAAVRALRTAAQGIGGWSSVAGMASGADAGTRMDARAGTGAAIVADVARRMLALQGQDAPGVRWSVGLRGPGVTDAAVASALEAAAVVRTWPMRGTLHLVHPDDVRWLLGLTAERMLGAMAARRSALGITPHDCARAVETAHALLGGGRVLGRTAFLAALDAAGVATTGQRGYHLLAWVAISGHVVLGGGPDAQPAIMLADDWLPPARPRERDEALAELALRYIAGHGPASEVDLARWVGLPVTQVRRGLAAAGDALETVAVGGETHHVVAGAVDALGDFARRAESERRDPGARARPRVHLLPGFDEYLLGYADRSAALEPEHVGRVIPGGNGMFRPTVLVDGRVVGTWVRTVRARAIHIRIEPFAGAHLPDDDLLLAAAAAYGGFAGRPATIDRPARPDR